MLKRKWLCRSVSLIAAYAVALQTVLTAMAIAPPAHGAEFSVLCSSANNAGGSAPPAHSDCPACCVAVGCAGTGAVVASATSNILPVHLLHSLAPTTSLHDRLAFWPSERPNSSRAPPV